MAAFFVVNCSTNHQKYESHLIKRAQRLGISRDT
jgi:hypothetical protein